MVEILPTGVMKLNSRPAGSPPGPVESVTAQRGCGPHNLSVAPFGASPNGPSPSLLRCTCPISRHSPGWLPVRDPVVVCPVDCSCVPERRPRKMGAFDGFSRIANRSDTCALIDLQGSAVVGAGPARLATRTHCRGGMEGGRVHLSFSIEPCRSAAGRVLRGYR